MGQANITEIEQELESWLLLKELPSVVGEFKLISGSGISGQILNIAAYVNEKSHCRLDIIYTSETFDYVPVKTVGLHTFRDERYFCRDKDRFAQMLLKHLDEIISDVNNLKQHHIDYEAEELHFEKWDYWRSLPKKIGDYELFITPDNPLAYINGSFVFLDYTDFIHGNQLYFSYNVFRNEIFAEMKQDNLPLTTNIFDVANSVPDNKKLARLTELLQQHLEPVLNNIKKV